MQLVPPAHPDRRVRAACPGERADRPEPEQRAPSGPSGPSGGGGGSVACTAADNVVGGTNNANVTNGNNYASLVRQTNPSTTSTANTDTFLCAGTLSVFQVTASGSPGAGNEYELTVRINDADTGLACTMSDAATTCGDAGTITVDPGDEVNVEINPNSDPTLRNFDWLVDVGPPTNPYP